MRFCYNQSAGSYRSIPTTYDDENDPNGEGRVLLFDYERRPTVVSPDVTWSYVNKLLGRK